MSASRPKVSVILPFFNSELTLNRAVISIQKQDFEDYECILVDNNSTDQSREVAEEWTRKDGRFRLICESRQGVMFASNRGAEMSRGKYLARMDSDDRAYPLRLGKQVEFLNQNPEKGAVAGKVMHVGERQHTEGYWRFV